MESPPVAAPPIPLHEQAVHPRSSLVPAGDHVPVARPRRHDGVGPQHRVADDPAGSRRLGVRPAVDRRRLCDRLRRAVVDARARSATASDAGGALLAGLGVFGLGTLIGGVATSSTQLIAGRAVMGIGAAFIMPATLSIITAIFPPRRAHARHRDLGRLRGRGRVDRPRRHRRTARRVLVGVDAARERAHRRRDHRGRRDVRSRLA